MVLLWLGAEANLQHHVYFQAVYDQNGVEGMYSHLDATCTRQK